MKTKVMIVEDNFYKSFTTKQILESQLKLDVKMVDVSTGQELVQATAEFKPDVIFFRPEGGVADLLMRMKKRHSNRRNTEITLVLAQEFDDEVVRKFQMLMERSARGGLANAA
jgi:chemotaxis response regulator CheB